MLVEVVVVQCAHQMKDKMAELWMVMCDGGVIANTSRIIF